MIDPPVLSSDIAHHSALLAFHSAYLTNFGSPKVSPSLNYNRSYPVRDSRCLDPDFGLAPITFEVSIMDWYAALHQTYQPVLACTKLEVDMAGEKEPGSQPA